ncbi:MAG: Lrp/AsnC family transcriptional regulator [Pseudomonadota bacterium]
MTSHVDSLDPADRRLLRELQANARRSTAELAEAAGLSTSACHRRMKQLESAGLVDGYVARVNREAVGYSMMFFIEATLDSQGMGHQSAFEAAVARIDEVLECHLLAGETDYLMKVVAADLADFERIHRDKLARLPHLARLRSNLMIREVRRFEGVPIRSR